MFGIAVVDSLLHVVRENNTMVEVFRPPSNKLTQLMSLRVINQTGLYDMAHLPKANLLVLLNWFDGTNVSGEEVAFKLFAGKLLLTYKRFKIHLS